MNEDVINYKKNIEDFKHELINSFIEAVYFKLDDFYAFNITLVPFNFKYCSSILIVTNSNIFNVITSQNDSGDDTFWIVPTTDIITISAPNKQIKAKPKNVYVKYGDDGYAYKITIEFEKDKLIIFAGDIHDTPNGENRYVVNDEMILVFEDDNDADTFERKCNCR
jgi:hypothetical protein